MVSQFAHKALRNAICKEFGYKDRRMNDSTLDLPESSAYLTQRGESI